MKCLLELSGKYGYIGSGCLRRCTELSASGCASISEGTCI